MGKNKFYVVWEGAEMGVFTSWEKCKAATKGYPNAKFKSFPTFEAAEEAFSKSYFDYAGKKTFSTELSSLELLQIGKPILDSMSVDAACSGNPGLMEYRGVYTENKRELFLMGPFEDATNNVGEFLALVHGLAFLKEKNSELPIYSDSKTAISWIKAKQCRTNVDRTNRNQKIFELIARAETWLKNNSYNNKILKWETKAWGEIPADFGRKK